MDKESIKNGGRASFFTGELEKYCWTQLFYPKVSGIERVKLYSTGIEKVYNNPQAPELFRNIFNNKRPENFQLSILNLELNNGFY